MKKISILTLLALFAATLTQQGGAWAQGSGSSDDWGQIKTATSAWTHITAGSTTGFELKDAYYYVSEDLTFSNTLSGAGQGSGLYVQADKTVYLYIPKGVTLTAKGANADGTTGAGAGILLPQGSTLHIVGEGTLVATGGNAADGGAGDNGSDGKLDDESVGTWFLGKKIYCGAGGQGGHGGGGAGAGIGTAGGNGGAPGIMTAEPSESYADWTGGDLAGVTGVDGKPGDSAAPMGTLYIQSTIIRQITGGAKGNGGAPGKWGKISTTGGEIEFQGFEMVNGIPFPTFDITDMQSVAGGGGGGGGAGGGSAQAIGTGGAGGGGGASGAHGSACAHNSWVNDNWGSVGAGGGKGGEGTDGNNGSDGATCWFQGEDNIFDDADNHKPGGVGGKAGAASVAVSAGAATAPEYTVTYYALGVKPSTASEKYNVGSSTTVTLPTLSDGEGGKDYKWILSIYGNEAGKNTTSHCAAPNTDVYNPGDVVDLSNIYGAIEFCAVYVGCEINCASETENYWSMGWAHATAGKYAVVNLKKRTLYKDGYWNSLTLPFNISKEKLQKTCLAGADIRTYKSASWDKGNKELTITFSAENDGEIKAGVPCLIRWGTPGNAPGGEIEDPMFTNVSVDLWNQEVLDGNNQYETASGGLRFNGQIGPEQLQSSTRAFVLGAENKLYKPSRQMWVYATHAYFTYTKSSGIDLTRSITIDLGDGNQETTYIDFVTADDTPESTMEGIFTLDGQRLDAPRKGINIINGKKVIIK